MSYSTTATGYAGGEQVSSQLVVWDSTNGVWLPVYTPTKTADLSAVTITTITTVITPTSGKKVRLIGGCISLSAAASVLFEDNSAGTTVFRTPALLSGAPYNFDLYTGKLLAAANNVLKATSSAAATITGTLFYAEE